MGLTHHAATADDPVRARRRRDLMLDDEPLRITAWEPRRTLPARRYVLWAGYVATAGVLWVVEQWPWLQRPFLRFRTRPATDADADVAIVGNADGSHEVCRVEAVAERPLELLEGAQRRAAERTAAAAVAARAQQRMVVYRHTRFVFDAGARAFRQLEPEAFTCAPAAAAADSGGGGGGGSGGPRTSVALTAAAAAERLALFGRNVIDIPIPHAAVLLLRECVHPFVAFQVFSVVLWCTENYFTYAAFIFVTAGASAVANFWEVRKNLRDIRALSLFTTQLTVWRRRELPPPAAAAAPLAAVLACDPAAVAPCALDSAQLVPGDLVELAHGMRMPADCVLLAGSATVNEAMLTGESTVVIKAPLPAAAAAAAAAAGGDRDRDSLVDLNAAEPRNTLFGGSVVVQLRVPPGQRVLAAVVRTGFDSVKGRLVLSILHPKSAHFKFLEQSFVFIGLLFAAALVGLGITIDLMARYGAEVGKMVQRGCDMVTIVVPPALPLALTVGVAYALIALRKQRVFCISPPRVNLAGKINCFCFDKTGTLTSDGLELACIRPVRSPPAAGPPPPAGGGVEFAPATSDLAGLSDALVALLATCHTLTYVEAPASTPAPATGAGTAAAAAASATAAQPQPQPRMELSGDPLEVKTFNFTGASLVEPHCGGGGGGGGGEDADGAAGGGSGGGAGSMPTAPSHQPPPPSYTAYVSVPAATAAPPPSSCDPRSLVASQAQLLERQRPSAAPTPSGGGAVRWAGYVLRQFEFVPALQRMGVLVQPQPRASGAAPFTTSGDDLFSVHGGAGGAGGVISFVKGSPEVIASLCEPSSLPRNYAATLAEYTHQGFRVLAAGARALSAGELAAAVASCGDDSEALRRACEARLRFLGFIVLENALKPETAGVIRVLTRDAGMPVHMVTGDNPVSAVCIARQCGMVEDGHRVFIGDLAGELSAHALGSNGGGDSGGGSAAIVWHDVDDEHATLDPGTLLPPPGSKSAVSTRPFRLAMTGRAFSHLLAAHRAAVLAAEEAGEGGAPAAAKKRPQPRLWPFHRALLNCAVFARMSPENKAQLVEELQATGLYVGMCGDGANDSLALRAAHVGVSLSQVEASVSAPFTSMVPNISCVPLVLAQGRGALTTSFCLFQFMALYSTIQFANAMFAVTVNSFLSNNEYLYQDLFTVFILALTLGSTPANASLTRKRPSGQLLSAYNLALCGGFILLTFVAQGAAYVGVRSQPWYGSAEYPTRMGDDPEGTNASVPETSSVFLVAMYQYVAVAIIFSVGHPWKQPTWTNTPFCGWLLVVVAVSTWVLLCDDAGVYRFLGVQRMPRGWHAALGGYAALGLALYAVFIGGAWLAKARGWFAALGARARALRGAPPAAPQPHKPRRAEWRAQLGRLARGAPPADDAAAGDGSGSGGRGGGGGGSGRPMLQLAGTAAGAPSSSSSSPPSLPVVRVTRDAGRLARVTGASARAAPLSSPKPMEDDTAGGFGSPPPLGGVAAGAAAAAAAAGRQYSYQFHDPAVRVPVPFAGVEDAPSAHVAQQRRPLHAQGVGPGFG